MDKQGDNNVSTGVEIPTYKGNPWDPLGYRQIRSGPYENREIRTDSDILIY